MYNVEMQTVENRNLPKRTRYYQGMIDFNILEKGENYKNLKKSFVIFVCTFDLFGEGRHIYTFENRCIESLQLPLGDDAVKIILNTKRMMDDVTHELKSLLDYIDGAQPDDDFTKELEDAVDLVRRNEKWRLDYMTLQQEYREKYNEGLEAGKIEGKMEGKIELLYLDFQLTIPEIARKLELSEKYVQGIVKEIEDKK